MKYDEIRDWLFGLPRGTIVTNGTAKFMTIEQVYRCTEQCLVSMEDGSIKHFSYWFTPENCANLEIIRIYYQPNNTEVINEDTGS